MEDIVLDVIKAHNHIYEHKETPLRGPLGEGSPRFDTTKISFNGDASTGDDHETFEFERVLTPSAFAQKRDDKYFQFTKTAHKPYDLFVCVVLLILKRYLRGKIRVMSDGDLSDWRGAIDAVNRIFDRNDEYVIDEGELKATFDDDDILLFSMYNTKTYDEISLDARTIDEARQEALAKLDWEIRKHE